jgi:hypothetical protein
VSDADGLHHSVADYGNITALSLEWTAYNFKVLKLRPRDRTKVLYILNGIVNLHLILNSYLTRAGIGGKYCRLCRRHTSTADNEQAKNANTPFVIKAVHDNE